MAPPSLRWTPGRTPVAHIAGEIDLASAAALFAGVRRLLGESAGVVLDLSELAFIDSAGLSELIRLARDMPVRLVAPRQSEPRGVFEIMKLADVVPTFATVEAALR